MCCGEALFVDEYAYQELSRRRHILQEPQRCQSDAFGSFAIQQQGNGSHCASQEKKEPDGRGEGVECRLAVAAK